MFCNRVNFYLLFINRLNITDIVIFEELFKGEY